MSPLRRITRDRSFIAVVVLLVFGSVILMSHSTPAALDHDAILRQILTNVDHERLAASPEPIEYIHSQIESDYTRRLFQTIEEHLQLRERLKADYVAHHHHELVTEIVREVARDQRIAPDNHLTDLVDNVLTARYSKKAYYDDIIERIILHNAPKCPNVPRGNNIYGYGFNNVWNPCFSRKFLGEARSPIDDNTFHELQDKHDSVVEVLRQLPEPPQNFVSGDGIVISGGASYLMGALTVIGQIRETGSVLPIELVLAYQAEYDDYICEKLLPRLNGRCVVIENEIGAPLMKKLKLERFQLKILGLLVSSFDNIIALDADNFPLQNVDSLLDSDVYRKNKFILWPDLWHKGTSPTYYDIARFKFGEPVRRQGLPNSDSFIDYIKRNRDTDVMLHDLEGAPPAMSVETGQMVFSKRAHFRSFLLALYYNVYGYSHYYELLFQGVFGEGDRETFVPALHVMNEPYHLVTRECWLAGFRDVNDGFFETTIVQYNPQESEDFAQDWRDWLVSKGLDSRMWPFQVNDYTKELMAKYKVERGVSAKDPSVMFLHIHRPKINAEANAKPHDDSYDEIFARRNLGLPGVYPSFGETDWELRFHAISKWIACDALTGKHFWRDIATLSQTDVCDAVTRYVDRLKRDSPDTNAAKLEVLSKIA